MDSKTERMLRLAGWTPEYRSSPAKMERWKSMYPNLDFHDAAADALSRYGGIRCVPPYGSGESVSADAIDLNPELLDGEEDLLVEIGEFLGKSLFPLGEGAQGQYYMFIADDGYVYSFMGAVPILIEVGHNIDDALDNQLLGRPRVRFDLPMHLFGDDG